MPTEKLVRAEFSVTAGFRWILQVESLSVGNARLEASLRNLVEAGAGDPATTMELLQAQVCCPSHCPVDEILSEV